MSKGIIGGALAGLGQGIQTAGKMWHASMMQEQAAEIMKARDELLAELRNDSDASRHQMDLAAIEKREQVRRQPYRDAAAEVERGRSEFIDDLSGTVRTRGPGEMQELERDAYMRNALPEVALRMDEAHARRDREGRMDRNADRQHEERMQVLQRQLATQERALARQFKLDGQQSTALTTNISFMVQNGIAKDPGEAFTMLRTGIARSPEQTLQQVTMQLMRSGDVRYRGQQGQQRAVEDAKALMGRLQTGEQTDFGADFSDAARGRQGQPQRRPLNSYFLPDD